MVVTVLDDGEGAAHPAGDDFDLIRLQAQHCDLV